MSISLKLNIWLHLCVSAVLQNTLAFTLILSCLQEPAFRKVPAFPLCGVSNQSVCSCSYMDPEPDSAVVITTIYNS